MKTFEEAKLSPEIIQAIQTSIERRVDGHDIQAFLKGLVILSTKGGADEFTRKQIVAEVDPIRTEFTSNVWADGSVAKIVKLEHAWRRLDGRNDDGFQVAPFPG
ncbi:hypothetical protein [Sphingomonas sp. LH128]|uniref:hypothetical protein n=1 Tax=Sphingomonas sp. LH128 TaxID=473781 RepID=UPI000A310C30|nr:hypothetical protein [Sphingomonas sp. LH128]